MEVTTSARPEGEVAGLCHYQGEVRGRKGSWAALSTCHGVSGVVFDGEELHYVERVPESPAAVTSPHYVFKHSHVIPQNLSCGKNCLVTQGSLIQCEIYSMTKRSPDY
ncbi:Disintegrin and metalloproteinase domain-containing protein 22 [Chionoecetes opilio]|uniref:Disintegrin and metalloproteinase domain-containing protein 22 n=1 Tax=Chionoecetes opilio TaxID=41210 RepID=A0A8J4YEQ2_CHIOP|nr:Disintegrin and metalloproteinase domain-containing protein 22 [Chionoecetes opilio]